MFSDIKTLKVLEHDGNHWRINLRTTAFDCGAHDYDVRFDDAQTAHLRIDAPGADAHALIAVKPGSRAGESIVTYSLYVQATGIVSWFVSEGTLRKKQEYMVTKYLTDLQRVQPGGRRGRPSGGALTCGAERFVEPLGEEARRVIRMRNHPENAIVDFHEPLLMGGRHPNRSFT